FNAVNMNPTETIWRQRAVEEFDFLALKNWPQSLRDQLESGANPQPCLSFDRISPSIKRVENGVRMNPAAAKINPKGSGATKKEAEITQGLMRHIDVDSRADIPQEVAFRHMLTCGRGWFRVNTVWDTDDDGDEEAFYRQKLVIQGFNSPFAVYPGPHEQLDARDMMYAFIPERMSKSVYKAKYPKSQLASLSTFTGIGDDIQRYWFPDGEVITAEYYYVECDYQDKERELLQLSMGPGQTMWIDAKQYQNDGRYEVLQIQRDRRRVETRKVKWA